MKKFMGLITHNFGFKIVSVIIAIVIWYAVVYYNDPIITQRYEVSVDVINESYIENGKQLYMIDEQYKTVNVFIRGNRSELDDITAEDIHVTADLTQIVDLDKDPIMVPLTATCPGFDETDITLSRTAIPITIENVASKELQVSVNTGDSVVNKNYEVGKLTPNPSSITIYGPESIIHSIESVMARIDINGLSSNTTVSGQLVFIDMDQNEISDSIIDDDVTFEGGEPDVTVDVELWKKKSDISIDVGYSGTPASGYEVTDISTTPEMLTVAGSDEALAALEAAGNKITIPADEVDVSGASEDFSVEVPIGPYLPDNVKLSASMNDTVIIRVSILPVGSTEIAYDVDNINVNNLSDSLTLTYDTQEVKLRISGLTNSVPITADQIQASIDLAGLGEGDHSVKLNVTLPDGYELVSDANITIHLKNKR